MEARHVGRRHQKGEVVARQRHAPHHLELVGPALGVMVGGGRAGVGRVDHLCAMHPPARPLPPARPRLCIISRSSVRARYSSAGSAARKRKETRAELTAPSTKHSSASPRATRAGGSSSSCAPRISTSGLLWRSTWSADGSGGVVCGCGWGAEGDARASRAATCRRCRHGLPAQLAPNSTTLPPSTGPPAHVLARKLVEAQRRAQCCAHLSEVLLQAGRGGSHRAAPSDLQGPWVQQRCGGVRGRRGRQLCDGKCEPAARLLGLPPPAGSLDWPVACWAAQSKGVWGGAQRRPRAARLVACRCRGWATRRGPAPWATCCGS